MSRQNICSADLFFWMSAKLNGFKAKSCAQAWAVEIPAIHPERMAESTAGDRTHPEGMTETTTLAPISECDRRIRRRTVVGASLTTDYLLKTLRGESQRPP